MMWLSTVSCKEKTFAPLSVHSAFPIDENPGELSFAVVVNALQ
jgi:hypothetical protein